MSAVLTTSWRYCSFSRARVWSCWAHSIDAVASSTKVTRRSRAYASVAVAAMLFNGLGDAAAALVGKRWGRHRTSWGKSWEGFAAGLVTDLAVAGAVCLVAPSVPFAAAAFGALVAATVEFAPLPVDDNVRVTLVGGAAIGLGMVLLA